MMVSTGRRPHYCRYRRDLRKLQRFVGCASAFLAGMAAQMASKSPPREDEHKEPTK
jgi:hypothetical protein